MATAVQAAEDERNAFRSAYERQQSRLQEVIDSNNRLAARRTEFLNTVRDYNLTIADYALNVAGSGRDNSTIVSMLIQPKTNQSVLIGRRQRN